LSTIERRLDVISLVRTSQAISKDSRTSGSAGFRTRPRVIQVEIGEAFQNEINSDNNFFHIAHRTNSDRYPCTKDLIDINRSAFIGKQRIPD
jgi:hypothetical protein